MTRTRIQASLVTLFHSPAWKRDVLLRREAIRGPGGIHIRSADDHDAGNPSDLRSDKGSKTPGT